MSVFDIDTIRALVEELQTFACRHDGRLTADAPDTAKGNYVQRSSVLRILSTEDSSSHHDPTRNPLVDAINRLAAAIERQNTPPMIVDPSLRHPPNWSGKDSPTDDERIAYVASRHDVNTQEVGGSAR